MSVRPSDYPPPWSSSEAIGVPTDPADERIDVGFLIVGAGPAGLAAAVRLGQLMEEEPETAERLGEVPVAVLEKGKAAGSHLLSGAVVNPRSLQRLFKGRKRLDEMPFAAEVEGGVCPVPHEAAGDPDPHAADDDERAETGSHPCRLGRWLGRGGGGARR